MSVVGAVLHALELAFDMFWEVFWPLMLGFLISAIVQSVVSRRAIVRSLGTSNFRGIALACGFGAASSSCSYAAVSVARGLFRKGATFGNAIIYEFAATNLVFELGLVLLVLLGWQFVGAEFAGGLLMVAILAFIFKYTLRPSLVQEAQVQAEKGIPGRMEGHGDMDMSVGGGPFLRRLFSGRALTAISHYFFMDLYSLYQDLVLGFLVAGALAAWVPNSFWRALFFTDHPVLNEFWGPLVGPLISMVSFVCSVGNVPLAAVLWNGGISFGGVISFIFADLVILPILNIYRKYYGRRMSLYLLAVSYFAMAVAGLAISLLFQALGIAPAHHRVTVFESHPGWNWTALLNVAFLLLVVVLGWRFLTTGGIQMLKAMDHPAAEGDAVERDPVCGMVVDPGSGSEFSRFKDRTYWFCSRGCREEFERDPEAYAGQAGSASAEHSHPR